MPDDNPYLRFIYLEQEIRQAQDETELQLTMVNRLRSLIPASHLMLFQQKATGTISLCRCSDVHSLDHYSPLSTELESIARNIQEQSGDTGSQRYSLQEAGVSSTLDWLGDACLWVPVNHPDGQTLGYLLLSRSYEFTDQEQVLASHITEAFAHAWKARMPAHRHWRAVVRHYRFRWAIAAVLMLLMFIPVQLTVLAPAEVIAYKPDLVTAPLNGVVKEVLVTPHERVTAGQSLVAFEDTHLRNQYNLAREEMEVAEAQLRKAQQQSFTDSRSTAQLAELQALVQLQRAKLTYAEELLRRSVVTSGKAGVVVFRDGNDWLGQPVQQGESILYVADPDAVEIQVMLSVRDAITLKAGTEVRLFLDTDPLNPLSATLTYASYDAEVTPRNILAYRLKASFQETEALPRIGLQGTAKLYGERSSLFMYLFRRPLSFLRQWLGG